MPRKLPGTETHSIESDSIGYMVLKDYRYVAQYQARNVPVWLPNNE